MQKLNLVSTESGLYGIDAHKISLSFYSFSDVIVGRENRDETLDGGGNALPNGYVSRCD